MGLIPCADRACQAGSWTTPAVAARCWDHGLCPSCTEPGDLQRVLALFRKQADWQENPPVAIQ